MLILFLSNMKIDNEIINKVKLCLYLFIVSYVITHYYLLSQFIVYFKLFYLMSFYSIAHSCLSSHFIIPSYFI